MKLILKIELVPSTSWYSNMRKYTTIEEWDRIRRKSYKDYDYKCGICGDKGRLNCHEIWEYDDEKGIQTLKGFIALCDMCHHVKHIGFANILASQGKLDYEKVVKHFMKVNKCDLETFKDHRVEALMKWKYRSSYEWKIELGEYKKIKK